MSIPFKVGITHGDGRKEFRIVRLADQDFDGLQEQIKNWTSASNFEICYFDDENDEIVISSKEEMKECCEVWREGSVGDKVKLFVTLVDEDYQVRPTDNTITEVVQSHPNQNTSISEESEDEEEEYVVDEDDDFEFSEGDDTKFGADPSGDISAACEMTSFDSNSNEIPLVAVPGNEFSVLENPCTAHFESPIAEAAGRIVFGDRMIEYIITGQIDLKDAGCSDWLHKDGCVLVISNHQTLRDKLAAIADAAFRKRNYDAASKIFKIAVEFSSDKGNDYYFLAKALTCANNPTALDTIIEGVQHGVDILKVINDCCFKELVNSKVFQETVINIYGADEPEVEDKNDAGRRALVITQETLGSTPFNDREEQKYGTALNFLAAIGRTNTTRNKELLRLKDGEVFEVLRIIRDS